MDIIVLQGAALRAEPVKVTIQIFLVIVLAEPFVFTALVFQTLRPRVCQTLRQRELALPPAREGLKNQ